MFFNAEFSAPWSLSSPPSLSVAPYLAPGVGCPDHLPFRHGRAGLHPARRRCTAALHRRRYRDIPHSDAHVIVNGLAGKPMEVAGALKLILSRQMKPTRFGGGGEVTKFVCG
ncbi:MAG: hypothetical protein ACRD7E_32260 [Bryobacteraceae bacterium]